MTPVEGEVIAAAVAWYRSGGKAGLLDRLSAAVAEIAEPERTASSYPCWECLTDPTEDPSPWCDDRPEDFGRQDPNHPCRLRAHAPDRCLNRVPESSKPVWVETTMGNCLINDRIRLGSEEATVLRSNRGVWNVDTRNKWEPAAWKHEEFRMSLDVVPEFTQYPAGLPVEILCTPERLAALRIQEGFPGSTIISSDVN